MCASDAPPSVAHQTDICKVVEINIQYGRETLDRRYQLHIIDKIFHIDGTFDTLCCFNYSFWDNAYLKAAIIKC